jgi:hypothetical protein
MIKHALKYREAGFSVIPIKPDYDPVEEKFLKKPYTNWKAYQRTLPTVEEITSWWTKWPDAMIGIVTGDVSNVFAIDCDTEESYQKIQSMIPDSFLTPTVSTPRGGKHLWVKCSNGNQLTTVSAVMPDVDTRGNGGYVIAPPSKNEKGGKYEWLAGLSFEEIAIEELPHNIINNNYLYKRVVDKPKHDSLQTSTQSTNVYTQGTRDQDLFHIAHLLVKAGCEDNYLIKTLEILAMNCVPPFPLSEVKVKIESALERANRKTRNLSDDVRDYILSTSGVFLSTDIAKCLHLSTREDLKNLSIILKRLNIKEHLIEKYGNKNGTWRTVDTEEEIIDIFNADLRPFNVKMPLKIHEHVNIHKGNVIIIAGESNAGKTSFCLNVARLNRDNYFVNYLSSEMQNGAELRIRLDEFEENINLWKPVKFQFRTDNFPDKIVPDAINVIDYLDEGTDADATRMPARIRDIANKLKEGIAIIAIQKDPQKQYGYGGAGTMNRSRLYLTVTRQGVMTIVKAKMWKNKNVNPNGMFCNYKLAAGCKYYMEGDWKW